jgi:RNA polymerase sigma-70 factor (ECF subfamily)
MGDQLHRDAERWVERLRVGHPQREMTVRRLHDVLRRVAFSELSRRRRQRPTLRGPEFEDLAQQAADDALLKVLDRLDDFRGLSRFTTWAYRFVIFEVSAKVARHAWGCQPLEVEQLLSDRLPDSVAPRPEDRLERQAQLQALSQGIGELTKRQREVLVAIALNDTPVEVVAAKLETNRNAIYKNLFDARRSLRAKMSAAGHPVGDEHIHEIATAGNRPRCAS